MKRLSLINARKRKGLNRREAAQGIGVSEIYLRKLEAGDLKPGRDALIRIERYYGVSMRQLFDDIFMPYNDTKCIES